MINIKISPANFEYDVQSLVQAFYPGEEFKIIKIEELCEENSSENRAVSSGYRVLDIKYKSNTIEIIYNDGSNEYKSISDCDFIDRRETKNILKQALYNLFSKAENKQLAWGNLTGIRPVKIPALMLEKGMSRQDIEEKMRSTYSISDEKLKLSMEIALREHEILSDIDYKDGYSLYVGIPFCPTTCLYCSFTSYPISLYEKLTETYVDTVIKEMKYVSQALKGRILNTVYIGGGTPTTLSASQLDKLIKSLKEYFDFKTVKEFTVEAGRPDSITEDKLITLKQNGVDRISINPQTMNEETLKLIGRRHTVEQVIEAFNLARKCGFDNINMDLIIGLPQEDGKKVTLTMEEILALKPDSLTVHSLAVKRAARLNTEKEKYENYKMENSSKLMELTEQYARKMDMKPYYLYRQKNMAGNQENVGYSTYGKEGIYNILMMGDKQNVIAIGAGATTKLLSEDRLDAVRVDNVKNVELYIERIDEMIQRKKNHLT